MSRSRRDVMLGALAPSALLLLIAIVGLALGSYWQYVLALSISSAVVGAALSMLVAYARCITIATGAMLAIGAYCAATAMLHIGAPFMLALCLAALAGALAGIILAVPGVRFRGHNLAMVTLVFQAVVVIVLREAKAITGGAEGLHFPVPTILGVSFTGDAEFLLLCGALCGLAVLPLTVLLKGAFGKNLRAVASNENAARAFGITVDHHLIAAFAWSSAAIAFAGAISAPRFRIIDPDSYGVISSIFALAYPIVGGMGSIWGGLLGGATLRLVPEILRPLADYMELFFCALVVATLVFLPDGLASAFRRVATRSGRAPSKSDRSVRTTPSEATPQVQVSNRLDGPPATLANPGTSSGAILHVGSVSKAYGALRAVDGVSLEVAHGALHGLMGPNGAGKTTLFNIVSGFVQADYGTLTLGGIDLATKRVEERLPLGITRTFQHAAIFHKLSCLDNVRIGLGRNGIWSSMGRSCAEALQMPSSHREREAAWASLEAVGLAARARDPAGELSLGDQRRLEIARAIVSRPRIILLDEPVSGVAVEETERIRDLLTVINRELGITMLVIEHNIAFLASLCRHISVMSEGKIIAEGQPKQVLENPRVRRIYFGELEAVA